MISDLLKTKLKEGRFWDDEKQTTSWGGKAHPKETLDEFIGCTVLNEQSNLIDVNAALKACNIQPIVPKCFKDSFKKFAKKKDVFLKQRSIMYIDTYDIIKNIVILFGGYIDFEQYQVSCGRYFSAYQDPDPDLNPEKIYDPTLESIYINDDDGKLYIDTHDEDSILLSSRITDIDDLILLYNYIYCYMTTFIDL